eukprot:1678294-Alexandrium_andersonii.AAC.1
MLVPSDGKYRHQDFAGGSGETPGARTSWSPAPGIPSLAIATFGRRPTQNDQSNSTLQRADCGLERLAARLEGAGSPPQIPSSPQ